MEKDGLDVKKVEVPVMKENTSKDFRKEVIERREELVLLINDLGFFRARRMAKLLGEKYKVSERMIYLDFDWIKGNMKPVDLREIKIDLKIGRSRAYSEALDMLSSAKTNKERKEAIEMVVLAGKHYREELEAWGDKQKVAEKQEITGYTFEIIKPEVKNDNSNKVGTESKAGNSI